MSISTTTVTTTTTTTTTPWARAQGFGVLTREGEWDTVSGHNYYFFDSHGALWEVVSRSAEGAEPFGPRTAARRITEEWVRAERAAFDAWAEQASECDWCDGCGGGSRRRRELELMEDLMGLSPIEAE